MYHGCTAGTNIAFIDIFIYALPHRTKVRTSTLIVLKPTIRDNPGAVIYGNENGARELLWFCIV